MFLVAETELLLAVRDFLRTYLGDIPNNDIQIEIDDTPPATAGHLYVAIIPHGTVPGDKNNSMDLTHHYQVGCRIVVFERITDIPRDRRRCVVEPVNNWLTDIAVAIRFNYTIINTANAALADRGRTGKFTRPLIPQGADSKPQLVTGEDYNSRKKSQQGDPWVAVKRGINFGMAEFFSQEERTED